jgi:hypothetical protein
VVVRGQWNGQVDTKRLIIEQFQKRYCLIEQFQVDTKENIVNLGTIILLLGTSKTINHHN